MILPKLLELVQKSVQGQADKDWASSIVSPFWQGAKGARIPGLQPTATVTATNFQDEANLTVVDTALIFTNFGAFGTQPFVILNGINQTVLNASPKTITVRARTYAPGALSSNVPSLTGGFDVDYVTRYVPFDISTNLEYLSKVTYGAPPGISGLFSSVRVASAGYRIFKTSSSQNESGTIKAYYSDRGSYVNKNLSELIDYY